MWYLPGKHQVCVGSPEECQGTSIYSTSSKPQLIFHMILLLRKHHLRHCSGQLKVAVYFTSSRPTASKFGFNHKSNQDRLARTISKFSLDLFFLNQSSGGQLQVYSMSPIKTKQILQKREYSRTGNFRKAIGNYIKVKSF